MSPKRSLLIVIGLGICLALIGCSSTPEIDTSTDTPLAQVEPSATSLDDLVTASPVSPTVTSADTAVPSVAPLKTSTMVPTAPPPPTSVVPLEPEGDWLLFTAYADPSDKKYLYAVNDDGTGAAQLIPEEHITSYAVQPGRALEEGVTVAYITRTEDKTVGRILKLLNLPGGEVQTVTPLLSDTTSEEAVMLDYELGALAGLGGLAWSPDGRMLAFIGGMDGESVDVYA